MEVVTELENEYDVVVEPDPEAVDDTLFDSDNDDVCVDVDVIDALADAEMLKLVELEALDEGLKVVLRTAVSFEADGVSRTVIVFSPFGGVAVTTRRADGERVTEREFVGVTDLDSESSRETDGVTVFVTDLSLLSVFVAVGTGDSDFVGLPPSNE